jgi:hypothetical protein
VATMTRKPLLGTRLRPVYRCHSPDEVPFDEPPPHAPVEGTHCPTHAPIAPPCHSLVAAGSIELDRTRRANFPVGYTIPRVLVGWRPGAAATCGLTSRGGGQPRLPFPDSLVRAAEVPFDNRRARTPPVGGHPQPHPLPLKRAVNAGRGKRRGKHGLKGQLPSAFALA